MSKRIFVAYEDPTNDPHIGDPVIEALFRRGLGHSQARVQPPISNPRIRGVTQLLENVEEISTRYAPMAYCVVFAADLDGEDGSAGAADRRAQFENRVARLPDAISSKVLVVLGVQELEVWALWGARAQLSDAWVQIRAERDPKEKYFEGLLTKDDALTLGGGRRRLVSDSLAAGWESLAQGCPELGEAVENLRHRGF